jgi:gamma-D-glutamyl-L-lysine dipeptidyl-peptidase
MFRIAARTPRLAGSGRSARGTRRAMALTSAVTALLAGCGSAVSTASAGSPPAGRGSVAVTSATPAVASCVSGSCWVDVTVATAWVKPWYPRPVDTPSLTNPAYPGRWVQSMTLAQKQWLVGKLETQALYGTRVVVTGHWNHWTHVAIPSQPTNRDTRGYPGWIPTRQLTATRPPTATTNAVIRYGSAWLWSGWGPGGVSGSHLMLASYDTMLPVVRATSTYVEVKLIGGRYAAVRRSAVALHTTGTSWGASRARVYAEARKFLGLGYLWAGTSGFGFDCSGFTYSIYRAYGITLSRDADQQAVHGTPVARTALTLGDLVFFRDSTGAVIHVGMYVGSGKMIDAPHTGAGVRIEPVWWSSYAGARRYLSS